MYVSDRIKSEPESSVFIGLVHACIVGKSMFEGYPGFFLYLIINFDIALDKARWSNICALSIKTILGHSGASGPIEFWGGFAN